MVAPWSESIKPSRYKVVSREMGDLKREESVAERLWMINLAKRRWRFVTERGGDVTLPEAVWCVWAMGISISDSKRNNLHATIDNELRNEYRVLL